VRSPEPSVVRRWAGLGVLVVACSALFALLHLPSAVLFGALTAGLVHALGVRDPLALPQRGTTFAQALLGTAIGARFDLDTLRALEQDWVPVLGVCLATLALSIVAGSVLRLHPAVSPATGAFAMIAGGASGIVAISRELGADDRIVAVVQYLRVLVIILLMPVITQAVFHPGSAPATAPGEQGPAWPVGLLFTVVCVLGGLGLARVVARVVEVPAASLLLPLGVAVAVSLSGVLGGAQVPAVVQALGFALIGVQVGLRFTRDSLRSVLTLLPLALLTIAGLIVASAGLGVLLARATGVGDLAGYLATTPGGLYAVLATAIGTGADITFVLTVQLVRVFVMLFSAPLLARWLRRSGAAP
jgi:membrane AbrB-like protein